MRGNRCWVAVLGALLVWGMATNAGAASIRIDPPSQGPIKVGDTATVSIYLDAVPVGASTVFGFGFRVGYDASYLSAAAPVIDAAWTGLSSVVNNVGDVGATANLLGSSSGQSGSNILLATITFTGVQENLAGVLLSLSAFTAPGDNILFDQTFLDSQPSVFFADTASISVMSLLPTPEPGLALMGLFALGALAARSRFTA
jgi:hypothetical protein